MKSEEFLKMIEKGEIGSLYFLYGEEPHQMERAVKRLLERLVDPGFRDFNLDIFYGNECKGEEIYNAAQILPMFVDRRVVLVKKSQDLSAAALEVLTPYVQNPSASTCLIFQSEKIDARKKFFLEFKKKGELVEFKRPYDNQLGQFIRDEAKLSGKRIEPPAIELLAHLVGNNLQDLAAQMEKLVIYVGSKETICLADVKEIVSDTKVDTVFEFVESLGGKNLGKSMRNLHTLLRDGVSPLLALNMLARHFRQLWSVRELLDRKLPSAEISRLAGINPYFLKKVADQAGCYRSVELKGVFEKIFEIDLAFKSGGGKPEILLEQLVMDLCK
jgi:DNA polymerase-3 subunit delta